MMLACCWCGGVSRLMSDGVIDGACDDYFLLPVVPEMQSHEYRLLRSRHVPLCWHGFDIHSLISFSQFWPT